MVTLFSIYCFLSREFFKNDKSIRGNWPPANEVAKECIVDGVCQWRWRSGREEEVICNGCHDKHMEAPRVKKRRRDGGVSRSYQKRDENYHDGYYVTQKWVSSSYQAILFCSYYFFINSHRIARSHQYKENFDLERCSSCKKYMRPVDLGDDEEDN